jgi:hypothetical protein
MTPEQYHEVLIGLDRALFVMHEARDQLSDSDRQIEFRIAVLRSQILKAESGHPFPFFERSEENDPDITRAPWTRTPSP